MPIGIIESLTYSTVRIECTSSTGQQSTGTGFFFGFVAGESGIPLLVTNKHVIAGAKFGRFVFTLTRADASGLPDIGNLFPAVVDNFEQAWIPHPDSNIDLAIMPMAGVLEEVHKKSGRYVFYCNLGTDLIPPMEERKNFSTMEEVLMIGYPNGIWDQVNNLPVIRRGITASHVGNRWNGRDEFLIDVATFHGSSGSPVFLVNIGSYRDAYGNTFMGQHRIRLLGINHSVMLHHADGVIRMIDTPTAMQPVPITGIPNNLGVAVNSQRLLDFEPILHRLQQEFEQRRQTIPVTTYPKKIY